MENKIQQRHYVEDLLKTGCKNFKAPALPALEGISTTMERHREAVTRYHMPHVEMVTTVTLGNICEYFQGVVLHSFHWHKCGPTPMMWQYCN